MEKTRKAEFRSSIRMWNQVANAARSNMIWWFNRRHNWQSAESPEQGYQHCYLAYKRYKRDYKFACERIVYWTNKYLAEYKA